MIGRRIDPCALHRANLVDFLHGSERTLSIVAALRHLDGCRACEAELTDIALAVAALRRLGHDLESVEPPADAWPGLRSRIERPRQPVPRWTTSLAGTLSAFGLIVALSARVALGPVPTAAELSPDGTVVRDRASSEQRRYDSGRGYLTESLILVLSGRSPEEDVVRPTKLSFGAPIAVDRSDRDHPTARAIVVPIDMTIGHRAS